MPVFYSTITGVSVSTLNLLLLSQIATNSKSQWKVISQFRGHTGGLLA